MSKNKPGSTIPVTTQIVERPEITDEIERQKVPTLNAGPKSL
jgi:hypothetical protein